MYSLDGKVSLKPVTEIHCYKAISESSIAAIDRVMTWAKEQDRNKILIDTNLKLGIPRENVNKVAGPFIEAWAYEVFNDYVDAISDENIAKVEPGSRLNLADIIMHICNVDPSVKNTEIQIDVKATSYDISYNPALGTGQLQIRDIHHVGYQTRTSQDICELLDKKCIASKKGFSQWYDYAKQYGWLND